MGGNGSLAFWLQEVHQRGLGQPRPPRRHAGRARRHRLPALRREERRADAQRPLAHRRLHGHQRRVSRRHSRRRDPHARRQAGARAVRHRRQPAAHDGQLGGRLRDAFEQLELLVTLDIFRNETGSLAHYILPCTSPLRAPRPAVHLPADARAAVKPVPAGDRARGRRPTASSATRRPSTSTSRARAASTCSARGWRSGARAGQASPLHAAPRASSPRPAGGAAVAAAARHAAGRLPRAARASRTGGVRPEHRGRRLPRHSAWSPPTASVHLAPAAAGRRRRSKLEADFDARAGRRRQAQAHHAAAR